MRNGGIAICIYLYSCMYVLVCRYSMYLGTRVRLDPQYDMSPDKEQRNKYVAFVTSTMSQCTCRGYWRLSISISSFDIGYQ